MTRYSAATGVSAVPTNRPKSTWRIALADARLPYVRVVVVAALLLVARSTLSMALAVVLGLSALRSVARGVLRARRRLALSRDAWNQPAPFVAVLDMLDDTIEPSLDVILFAPELPPLVIEVDTLPALSGRTEWRASRRRDGDPVDLRINGHLVTGIVWQELSDAEVAEWYADAAEMVDELETRSTPDIGAQD